MKNKSFNKTLTGKTGKDLLNIMGVKVKHASLDVHVGPTGETETTLYAFWKSLLGHDDFGVKDDFFLAGGNSLKAIQLLSRISAFFLVEVSLTEIFLQPTIAQIAELIGSKKNDHTSVATKIEVAERPQNIPLSFNQERLWFIDQLEGSVQYHLPAIFRLQGKLNTAALSFALTEIVNRHEVLRTNIQQPAGVGCQVIREKNQWRLSVSEGTAFKKDIAGLKQYIQQLVSEPFDLSKDHLLRAHLLRIGTDENVLVVTLHHIASDGWSTSVIINELAELYKSFDEGHNTGLAPLPVQYADFAIWQRQYLQGVVLDKKLDYWKGQLADSMPLQLPVDFSRPAIQSFNGASLDFAIDKNLTEQLNALGNQQGVTLFMTLLAAFKALLYRYSGQQDISVGTASAGRRQQELEGLVGFFVNTLALRSQVNHQSTFAELLQQVKLTTLQAFENQDMPFEKVVEAVVKERDMSRSPLFQVMFVLQNTPDKQPTRLGEIVLSEEPFEINKAKFEIDISVTETAEGLHGTVEYCTDLYKEQTVQRMMGHFKELLKSILTEPQQQLAGLTMLTIAEQNELLLTFNDTKLAYPNDKSIVDLFEDQVLKTPTNTALVFAAKSLTYKELNERSNQLAHYLTAKGVKGESLVPICVERGLEMIVAILAILKSGGAYVPVDPAYPEERIGYMLKDVDATLVLTNSTSRSKLSLGNGVELVSLDEDWTIISKESSVNPKIQIALTQLAYVIYTSGSTGKPKGVMIEHYSMLHYLLNNQANYISDDINTAGSFIHLTYTFDASLTGLFMPLLSGKLMVIATGEPIHVFDDPNLLKYAPYDFIKITPSHLELMEHTIKAGNTNWIARKLVIGGEALHIGHFNTFITRGVDVSVINEYGPTETTVGCTTYSFNVLSANNLAEAVIPIGKPIDNTAIYILGNNNELVPIGVSGELYVAGSGLARGYLNRADLTVERFIINPFSKEAAAKMYRTGDIGRWMPDGNIEYLGRKDEQVKIRGYRIELGEIESVAQQSGLASQVVVLARETSSGLKRLTGYVAVENDFDKEAMIAWLEEKLPDYMVPQLWVAVEKMPLTTNGKIDKKALPEASVNELTKTEYIAPRNDFEQHLADVWQKLLGIRQVGVNDNFFELGGDSILTIQVVSRMRRHGYELTPKDIFIYQTIARLSLAITGRTESAIVAEQGLLSGNSGLLPIQQWYFEQDNAPGSHYNQFVILGIEKSIGEATLNTVIEKLLIHHDALRFVYRKTDAGVWQQTYGSSNGIVVVENLQVASSKSFADFVKNKADEHRASLNIINGEMIRVVLLQAPAAEMHNRLLMVIHHLVVDGVSWRILLEDFEQLLTAISSNQSLQLAQKSNSYRQWYQALEQYGKSRSLLLQKKYWQNTIANYTSLPVDKNYDGKVRFMDLAHHNIHLNADYTKRLLQDVSKAYHTEINDILLCALSITLNDWSGNNKLVIGLEGHGREAIADDIDTSRTVGWFTSLYPVLLETDLSKTSGEQIKSIKEQLRKIPMHGIGYGVLKYINREVDLRGEEVWEIVFNYLGQLDNVVKDSNWFLAVGDTAGTEISGETFVKEKLLVNCHIQSGELSLNFSYSSLHYEASTISNLAGTYVTHLQALIEYCIEQVQTDGVVFTPSDYGLGAEISYEELDAFLSTSFNGKKRKDTIEAIYRLSGLQEGMLFHGLYDNEAGAYTEQFSCDLLKLNLDCLVKSWQHVIGNHSILRSGFYHDVFAVPVQCVYKSVVLPVETIDYRSLDEVEQIAAIKSFEEADRTRGFDFESAPLMRLTLIRLSEDRYRMLWTAHHILYDGWSLPILIEELLSTYDALVTGSEITVQEEDKYEDYIRFIERSNKEAEEDYWRKYLAGIEQSTLLPFIATTVERTKGGGIYKSWPLELDASSTQAIRQYAQQQRITVNTLMQGVWSLLLHRYTGSDDITFGVIVSGRPDELPNVEQRVGMYINTLPLHATLKANQQVNTWLQLLQEQQVTGRRYQYTPLREIQGWSGVQGDLFDSILVFENYPVSELIGSKQWSLAVENIQMHEQTNYPLSITITNSTSIKIGFSYNTSLLQDNYVAEIKGHFQEVLHQLVSSATDMVLSDANLLSAVEKNQLLQNFNDTKVEYPQGKTIVDLFEARAMKTPGNMALVFAEESLNYQLLNERSNQLAHYLKAKGVKEESLVPVCIGRSIDMVIAILGIVKAGGAYVPIDPGYPQERIAFIQEDTGATVVLTSSASRSKLVVGLDTVIISMDEDGEAIAKESTVNPGVALSANSLAYVIYTSGSTGKPKGVMIEHSGVVNLINWHIDEYQVHQNSRSTSMTGVGFDAFVWEIWPYLSAGAGIYIIDDDTRLSYIKLMQLFIDNFITHSFLSTALVPEFVNESRGKISALQFLLTGGDKLTALDLTDVNYSVINNYGPTENSVVTTNYKLTDKNRSLTPPIGKPIANNFIQILDEHLQLLPVGVAGELCIGGAGLARGYLNRPDLTLEKFIDNPFNTAAGSRLYKTGDFCRWLPDGNIEYLGRIDDQVKIRGYRIELGEIENVLQQSGLVNQAIVLAKENSSGVKRLIAYVVVQNLFNREAVIAYLSSRLPDYMVPQLWVALERLPLTSNGKIDKKALPDVYTNELATNSFVAPRNEFEKQMAATWQQLLGLVNVGIEDNFFELGGDSILTIQVVSRMRRHGFGLTPKDIFIHQNIAGLSAAIADKIGFEVTGEQGLLTGESGLLPIQQWYFEQDNAAVSHYNQSVLLGIEKSVGEAALSAVIEKLLSHHDALRFVYRKNEAGVWQQSYGISKGIVVIENLQDASSSSLADLIKNKADEHQALLNIARGELVRIVLIETPAVETHNRLLLIIHHLVIDGVSWRILLEDFERLLTAISSNQPLQPGSKSSSYRQWYQALELYGKSRNLLSQKEYWQNTIANDTSLPVDKNYEGKVRFMDMAHHSISLNSTATKRLLQEVPKVYHTEINDILLCALAITLNNWSGNNKLVIGLEGHGREDIADDIDASRTVGWFTNLYPVLLETGSAKTNAEQIKSIKEQLRRIPMRGIGYGVLKYINREVELQGKDVWEVVFNYLGQLDNVVKDSNWFTSVGESSGAAVASDIRVNEKLLVNSQVLSGELLLNFSYSSLHYEAATITNLAAAYLSNLLALIEHCIEQVQTNGEVFTPSDYGLGVEIGYEELDAFLSASFNGKKRKDAIESIYRLSGLQEGMLFHGLYDNEAGAYTEQFSCDLVKPDLNCLVKSWQHVIGNHSILRSGFYHDVFAVPVQCVYKSVAFPVETIDYCELNESEQAAAIIAFETADRAKGFDFESAPLMRLTLIRLSEDRYRMLWTSHHILFDGWSLPILMEELLGTYESLVTEKEPVVQEEDKFEDYIRFVERQNKEAEEQYWRQHIAGLEQSTLLPFIGKTVERTKGAGKYSTLPLHLEAPITLSIRQYAKQHHITLNTLMQGVWSLLLHRYTGNNDIAFGVIVSGRPDELPNVEQRVGMYINTLPLHAKLQEDLQLTAWLSRLQDQQVSGRKYQYTSLRQIQDWSGVGGDLFDSILVFENYPVSELIGSKQWLLEIENVQMHEQTNYPLSITIASADTIKIDFSYNTSLLQEIHVAEIRSHFEQVLNQFLSADAGTQLGEIELLTDAEKDQLLIAFNDTRAVYPADKSIISLFEEQVLITPEKIALVFEQERLSYRQLNDRSNQLAHHLAAKGVTIETLVPICIERGIEMMVAILGILKAGGAYVPIDPGYPAERIAFMLEDVAASMVLSSTASGAKLPDGIDVVSIDADWDAIAKESISKLAISTAPNDLAYIIYTSGSTGKPKGVLVTNNNVVSLVTGVDYVSIKREDVLLSTGSSSFDATTFEYWSMLLNGGQLVLCAENRLLDNQLLKEEINTRAVNKMWFTSSWFNQLVETDISLFETLETILVGGEKLSEYHIGKLRQTYPAIEIINGYGPTENTTFSLTYTIAESAIHQPIPIGRPLTNRTAYILDARQRLVPAGVSGEIYLSGDGLSRGYLNRPELTAEKFIKNPFASGLMYRTGDIGRWLPNGNIEYLGRIDDQVKIRGYRIELGEIETVIQQSELVSQAVIIVKDDLKGDKRLLAYIIPTTAYSKDALLAYLRTRLPEYMVPTTWIELVDFELTSNGKINKKALPDADAMPIMDSSYMAPQNELEIKLASIWQEVLKLKQISTSDNFFDLGGHSLSAMRVVSAVRKELDTRIAIKDLFLYPAISSLAKYLQSLEGSTTQKEIGIQLRPEHIPLSFSQKRLWVIDRLEGSNQYHIPLILKLKGNLNKEGLFFALQTIVDRHEVLRTVFYDVDGKGFQSVKERVGWKVLTKDGAHFKNDPAALKVYLEDLVKLPFDLSNDYPVRASLIELDAQEFVLAITMHHIASDAWSNPIAIKELGELYASFITGRNAVLASLKLQYVDYAIWQWSYLQGKVLDEKTAYWKKKMSGVKPLQLTTDFKRPAIKTNNGSILSFDISKQLTDQLSQLSQQQGVSLFMTLLATFKVLLHRYSGDEDICVGTSVANRPQQELEGLIGFFVNTLALRTEVTESALFTELLAKVKTTTIEALDHQDLPFEKVVEVAGIDRDISRSPLFQVMLVLPNIPIASELIIGDVVLSPVEMAATTSKFDFTFHIYQSGYGLSIKVEYNTDLFKENTIERMTEHYKQLLKSVVTMPEQRIDSLQMLTDDEENALMAEFD